MVKCKICGTEANLVGIKKGAFVKKNFRIMQCSRCHFSFISNPNLNYDKIYSLDYYEGKGADDSINYIDEINNFDRTLRIYEWKGILKIIKSLTLINKETRWLDYGCGTGGLVKYIAEKEDCDICGFETGVMYKFLANRQIPVIDRKKIGKLKNHFDIITAIEVLEHLDNPLSFLRMINKLLKPGGIFFYTTWNSKPFRNKLLAWRYVRPEVHISFYEPETMEFALKKTGLMPKYIGFNAGFLDILRPRILKNLGIEKPFIFEKYLPISLCSQLVQWFLNPYGNPVGIKPKY